MDNPEVQQEIPQNRDPAIFGAVYDTVTGVLELYGWTILIVVVAVVYISSKVKPWLYGRSQQSVTSSYKKMDSGVIQDRLEAMERARLRMQAQHDEEARKFAERQREKEDEKRRQRLEEWEKQRHGYSKVKRAPEQLPKPKPATAKSEHKKPLKPEYNPLMGGGSSGACYRPSRRGATGGG
ncbi:hypothetical protein BsWGS_17194 [Bradybaena similaris]